MLLYNVAKFLILLNNKSETLCVSSATAIVNIYNYSIASFCDLLTWLKLLLSINFGSKSNCDLPVVSSWYGGNVGECCGDKEDDEDDMDEGGGVVVAEAAVEHVVKIPIFGRHRI